MKAFLETFKPVRGYSGLYEVSDFGDVRSLKYGKVRYLKKMKYSNGYEYLRLYRDRKSKPYRVHRLVYEAFHGTIPDGYEIDHIDGDKLNNRLGNLRVVTPKENSNNPVTRKRYLTALRRITKDPKWREVHAKPVLQLDKDTGEVIREWESANDAARELGISRGNISSCCNGKRNMTGGFRWRFTYSR